MTIECSQCYRERADRYFEHMEKFAFCLIVVDDSKNLFLVRYFFNYMYLLFHSQKSNLARCLDRLRCLKKRATAVQFKDITIGLHALQRAI